MSVSIRVAAAADAAAIAALHAASWRSSYRGILSDDYLATEVDAERLANWQRRFSTPPAGQRVFLAEDDGPAGFLCAVDQFDPEWGCLVDNLHVGAERKGRGIGRMLMAAAAAWLIETAPERSMHLWVLQPNVDAQAFYRRLGGELAGEAIRHLPGGAAVPGYRFVWRDVRVLTR